jgi:hypothetical protein
MRMIGPRPLARLHQVSRPWSAVGPAASRRRVREPVVHTPQRGREITFKYLASAGKVLGGPSFRYVGEWRSDSGVVLEFENEIEGISINGVDIVTFSEDGGLITHFKVMVRRSRRSTCCIG